MLFGASDKLDCSAYMSGKIVLHYYSIVIVIINIFMRHRHRLAVCGQVLVLPLCFMSAHHLSLVGRIWPCRTVDFDKMLCIQCSMFNACGNNCATLSASVSHPMLASAFRMENPDSRPTVQERSGWRFYHLGRTLLLGLQIINLFCACEPATAAPTTHMQRSIFHGCKYLRCEMQPQH